MTATITEPKKPTEPTMKAATVQKVTQIRFLRNHPLYYPMLFAVRVRAKAHSHYAISRVLIEEGAIVTTDGHRLHAIEGNHEFPCGLYEVRMEGSTLILETVEGYDHGKFPKWRDVVPNHTNNIKAHMDDNERAASSILTRLGAKGVGIQYNFVLDAIRGQETCRIFYGEKNKPVKLEFGVDCKTGVKAITAVIMPMDVDIDA